MRILVTGGADHLQDPVDATSRAARPEGARRGSRDSGAAPRVPLGELAQSRPDSDWPRNPRPIASFCLWPRRSDFGRLRMLPRASDGDLVRHVGLDWE